MNNTKCDKWMKDMYGTIYDVTQEPCLYRLNLIEKIRVSDGIGYKPGKKILKRLGEFPTESSVFKEKDKIGKSLDKYGFLMVEKRKSL